MLAIIPCNGKTFCNSELVELLLCLLSCYLLLHLLLRLKYLCLILRLLMGKKRIGEHRVACLFPFFVLLGNAFCTLDWK